MVAAPDDPSATASAAARLEVWKTALLDLTRRNRLLFFSSARGARLQIAGPDVSSLYSRIVLDEEDLAFASPLDESVELAEVTAETEDSATERIRSGDLDVTFDGKWIKDVVDLQRKLYRLRADAQSMIAEQGINTLHVALGLVEWREAPAGNETVLSPLLLVPVELLRQKAKPYVLHAYEDDTVVNPTLQHKLSQDFGLALPTFDPYDGFGEDPDLEGFFAAVEEALSTKGWRVRAEAWLGHFTFQKLVMFQDLQQPGTAEVAAQHPVLGRICEVLPPRLLGDAPSGETLETSLDRAETFPVVDADSSQEEALVHASEGHDLVIQGPPGTGKSQTIVNLIAQAVRHGQSVLFVSEKRAALDVVYGRLEHSGLGSLCLEMHSNRANKRQVVTDLWETLHKPPPIPQQDAADAFAERRRLRDQLRYYVQELHRVRDMRGRSAFRIHGELSRLGKLATIPHHLPAQSILDLTAEQEAELLRAAQDLGASPIWLHAEQHPWAGARPPTGAFIVPETLRATLGQLGSALRQAELSARTTSQLLGFRANKSTLGSLEALIRLLTALQQIKDGFDATLLTAPQQTLQELAGGLGTEIEAVRAQEAEHARQLQTAGAPALAGIGDLDTLAARYVGPYAAWSGRLTRQYRHDRKRLRAIVGRKLKYRDVAAATQRARMLQHTRKQRETLEARVHQLAGTQSPVDETLNTAQWLQSLRLRFGGSDLPRRLVGILDDSPQAVRGQMTRLRHELTERDAGATSLLAELARVFPDGLDDTPLAAWPILELAERVADLAIRTEELAEWNIYRDRRQHAYQLGLETFLTSCERQKVCGDELRQTLHRALLIGWLEEVYRDTPALASFDHQRHEATISQFAHLDHELRHHATTATVAEAISRLPNPPPLNELRLLNTEHAKRKKHLPLRRLLPGIPTLLKAVKPCLLMSPLSVASYLPRVAFQFDLVIFDEASQVMPADAVGAILRAKQVLVLGDSKQLPPTNFFQAIDGDGDDDDGDGANAITGFESILDVCRGYLPELGLRWHYRSRDDRLIAFSNRRFYNGNLVTFPAADRSDDTGTHYRYVPDGAYDRGASRTNPPECRTVVDLVTDHLRTHPKRSLGVIALSVQQRDAIDLHLRRARQQHPELEPLLSEDRLEPFFVKNLEAVQGDERDDIIISVGYGPTEPGGRPSLNFGPVNREGGERRLNVAVTRARQRTTIVTSMRPEQLDGVYASQWEGPRILADYIRYAARGGRFDTHGDQGAGEPESDFEQAVYDALTARGLHIDCQVGTSGFRIDLAVRHPDNPHRYILGIECDGAAYHSAKTVRDRDRLRQEILEDLGWTIHRIWSTDWIKNPTRAADRVCQINQALVEGRRPGVLRIRRDPPRALTSPANPQPVDPPTRVSVDPPRAALVDDAPGVRFDPYEEYSAHPGFPLLREPPHQIAAHFRKLVELEAPVSTTIATRRIAQIYSYQRRGAQVERTITAGLTYATTHRWIDRRGSFLWRPGQLHANARSPGGSGLRRADDITDEELEAAILATLQQLGATQRDHVPLHASRGLGFGRTSAGLADRLEAALARCIQRGQCNEAEGFIVLPG